MMMHAYNELYLSDAIDCLSAAFDYAINICDVEPDFFATLFIQTGKAYLFEIGNPSVISGLSGVELAIDIITGVYDEIEFLEPNFNEECSKEYWAGWALAQYQWYTGKRFKDIFQRISLTEIIDMYHIYHEMDISHFIEAMEVKYNKCILETKLSIIRKNRGISQATLAKVSGVSLRSIQLYEQRVNDIDKAQAQTIYKLSKALGCEIEDLLENPQVI